MMNDPATMMSLGLGIVINLLTVAGTLVVIVRKFTMLEARVDTMEKNVVRHLDNGLNRRIDELDHDMNRRFAEQQQVCAVARARLGKCDE